MPNLYTCANKRCRDYRKERITAMNSAEARQATGRGITCSACGKAMSYKGHAEPKVTNNTGLTVDQIKAQPLLGQFMNYWRGRHVQVYAGDKPEDVLTIGTSTGTGDLTICREPRSLWAGRIDNNDWSDYH